MSVEGTCGPVLSSGDPFRGGLKKERSDFRRGRRAPLPLAGITAVTEKGKDRSEIRRSGGKIGGKAKGDVRERTRERG
jgi:hypothetical protein